MGKNDVAVLVTLIDAPELVRDRPHEVPPDCSRDPSPVSRSSLCRWLFCQSLAPHGPDFADAVTSDEALWREGAAKLAAST
jgi:hypothetical protein